MVYQEFLSILNRAKQNSSTSNAADIELFHFYLEKVDGFLDEYFVGKNKRNYEILKDRAKGMSFEEIGKRHNLSRQRINQIIVTLLTRVRNPQLVQGSKPLNGLFTLLCNIGEADIMSFIYYLIPLKHVLLIVLSDDLFEKSIQFEKALRDIEIHKAKKNKPKGIKKHFASDEEIRRITREYLSTHYCTTSLKDIADALMEDYNTANKYRPSGIIAWNRIMDVLVEMQSDGEIKRSYGKLTIE